VLVYALEAAAAATGQGWPTPSTGIREFIHDDVQVIGRNDTNIIGADGHIRFAQAEPLATAFEFAAEIAQCVQGVQRRVVRDQVRG
jgi:hypothetical protein